MNTSPSDGPASSPQVAGKKKRQKDKRRDPMESDVYQAPAEASHRRVIAVKSGRVCYSVGSDTNRWCNLRTFRKWMRHAELIHERTPSTEPPNQESQTA